MTKNARTKLSEERLNDNYRREDQCYRKEGAGSALEVRSQAPSGTCRGAGKGGRALYRRIHRSGRGQRPAAHGLGREGGARKGVARPLFSSATTPHTSP